MEVVFWSAVFLTAYPYLVYPLLMIALGRLKPRPVHARPAEPTVTVLIPAYNEADVIRQTLENKLSQNYPREKLQILVVSDQSDDGTDDIVREFSSQGVQLLRRERRQGKAAGLNEAVRHATGEILVFSDGNSLFHPDAIRNLVANFADPDVGYATGALGFFSAEAGLSGDGASAYVRFENWLWRAETLAGSSIGVNGGVDAIRRELYCDVPIQLITDFVLPLTVIAGGRRVVFEPRALSREAPNAELRSEFRMRVRVALRALQGLSYMRRLLNPVKYPLTAFCLVSHKLVRYMAFVFLALALGSNLSLALQQDAYSLVLALHLGGYALGFSGIYAVGPRWLQKLGVVPGYLLITYAAFAVGTYKFLRGESMATWRPRAGA